MVRAVTREKESFRGTQLTLLAFITLKSWTSELLTHVENLFNIETPLNVNSV